MKKKSFLLLPLLFFAILLGSCKKDYNASGNNNGNSTFDVSGTRNITSFTQKTENKTSDYAGMDFTFSTGGTLNVTGTTTASGTWSYSPSVAGTYGGPASAATLTISIVSGSTFTKLSRVWNVGASSATSFQLDHPQVAEDEHVTFTKK